MAGPFGDGKSGATGNGGGGKPMHPPYENRPQKMGDSGPNPDSIPAGGKLPFPAVDPGSRNGLVSEVGRPGSGRKPFKLGGDGPSMPATNSDDEQPVGDVDNDGD